jgi:hypothetical protein
LDFHSGKRGYSNISNQLTDNEESTCSVASISSMSMTKKVNSS